MASILVHLTCGPEDPTRATLAFLVAKTALAEGHDVTVFLAGEGVQLLRPATVDAVQGVGTGQLREHVDAVIAGGGKLYASKRSSDVRALGPEDLGGLPVELVLPEVLVGLTVSHDRVLSY